METHFKTIVVAERLHQHIQYGAQLLGGIYIERGRTSHKAESGNHSNKAEAMVAMHVTDKHGLYSLEVYLAAP